MPRPQSGILPEPGAHARFLVLRVPENRTSPRAVAKVIAGIPALAGGVAALDRRAKLACTVCLGSDFWDRLSPGRRPKGFRPLLPIGAGSRKAPHTGGDLLLHLVSDRVDLNFEVALRAMRVFGSAVTVLEDVAGFRYLDSRDLTGFIDGTENPKGRARAAAALIGAEDRPFTGGSFVLTQRYVHDLRKWAATGRRVQEAAIGRRKTDSRELPETLKPETAHIRRVVIEERGKELEILRHSFPYGTMTEAGLFFIAYTKDLAVPEKMLRRMMGASGDGLHDRLMDFTRAVSGATFFAPPLAVLRALGTR